MGGVAMSNLRQAATALLEYLHGYDTDYPEAAPIFNALRAALLADVTPAQMAHADAVAEPEQKSWFTVEELNEFATKLKEKAWKA